ncbi:hypothetical protein Tco_0574718, partial [Tanacetum coccineum]
ILEVDQIVPAFLKELIYRVLGLQVLFLELNRFGILLGEWEEGQVDLQEKLLGILSLLGYLLVFSSLTSFGFYTGYEI